MAVHHNSIRHKEEQKYSKTGPRQQIELKSASKNATNGKKGCLNYKINRHTVHSMMGDKYTVRDEMMVDEFMFYACQWRRFTCSIHQIWCMNIIYFFIIRYVRILGLIFFVSIWRRRPISSFFFFREDWFDVNYNERVQNSSNTASNPISIIIQQWMKFLFFLHVLTILLVSFVRYSLMSFGIMFVHMLYVWAVGIDHSP